MATATRSFQFNNVAATTAGALVVSQVDYGRALLDDFEYRIVLVHYHQSK
jgi:hypothetical protein